MFITSSSQLFGSSWVTVRITRTIFSQNSCSCFFLSNFILHSTMMFTPIAPSNQHACHCDGSRLGITRLMNNLPKYIDTNNNTHSTITHSQTQSLYYAYALEPRNRLACRRTNAASRRLNNNTSPPQPRSHHVRTVQQSQLVSVALSWRRVCRMTGVLNRKQRCHARRRRRANTS